MEDPDLIDVGELKNIFWDAVDKTQKDYEHLSVPKVTSLNQLTPLIRGILRQKLQEKSLLKIWWNGLVISRLKNWVL